MAVSDGSSRGGRGVDAFTSKQWRKDRQNQYGLALNWKMLPTLRSVFPCPLILWDTSWAFVQMPMYLLDANLNICKFLKQSPSKADIGRPVHQGGSHPIRSSQVCGGWRHRLCCRMASSSSDRAVTIVLSVSAAGIPRRPAQVWVHQLLLTEVESSCVPAQGFIELTVTRGTNSQGGPQSSPRSLGS